jgi:hypothetical protein
MIISTVRELKGIVCNCPPDIRVTFAHLNSRPIEFFLSKEPGNSSIQPTIPVLFLATAGGCERYAVKHIQNQFTYKLHLTFNDIPLFEGTQLTSLSTERTVVIYRVVKFLPTHLKLDLENRIYVLADIEEVPFSLSTTELRATTCSNCTSNFQDGITRETRA